MLTPLYGGRSGGGSRSGSSSSGGNSHPEKSTSSPIPDMLLEQVFEHEYFPHNSYGKSGGQGQFGRTGNTGNRDSTVPLATSSAVMAYDR
jgi:hypothetical protein